MLTFRARYFKDKITKGREETIVWCLYCAFCHKILVIKVVYH